MPRHLRTHPAPSRARGVRPLAVALALVSATGVTAVTVLDRSADSAPASPASSPAPAAVAAVAAEPSCIDPAPIEARVGLTLVVGLPGVTDAADPLVDQLADVGVGGVMLRDENLASRRQATELVAGLRERLGQQLLVAVDDEGGRVTSLGELAGPTPSARRLGRSGPTAARSAGERLGEVAASVGIDWVLAPVVDLDGGPAGGVIGDRAFGDDPEEVAETGGAFAEGLREAGVAVTLKHFPGHGAAHNDPHAGAAVDDRSRRDLLREDVVPFEALIRDGAEAVMVGHVTYPEVWGDVPASLAPGAYALLREQGFDGLALTDALGMGAVHGRWGFDAAPGLALAAGADAVLVNQGDRVVELRDGLVQAVEAGRLDEARLDEAVGRVLHLREQDAFGILCSPSP